MGDLPEYLDLAKAFRRVDQDKRDDAWPDIVGYRDYRERLEENLQSLGGRTRMPGQYKAGLPLCIDLPKRGYTLRPGVVPLIDDRIAYQAMADLLAPHFSPEPNVYSNKLAGINSNHMFVPGVKLWIAFQDKVAEYCHSYSYVVETDATAYFDHIRHDLLLSRIADLFGHAVDKEILGGLKKLLQRMWGRWSVDCPKGFGIPQINDASSLLANVYMDELDKWLLLRWPACLRYVDDIRIFAKSEPDARRALAELIVKMRQMGLYVSSGKTRIRQTGVVLGELAKERKRAGQIETDLDSGIPSRVESAAADLQALFLQLVGEPQDFDDRLFRFCINRCKRLYVSGIGSSVHERVTSEVLQRLASLPESTDVFVDYLSLFRDNEFVQTSVMDFLEGSYNIYPWQEMQLLELLVRQNLTGQVQKRAARFADEVIRSGRHPACKARAYVLRGKNGTYADRRDIRSEYVHEEREDVKRSIIVAIQEMKTDERNHFYAGVEDESPGIERMVHYVERMPRPTYDYFNPPRGYDIVLEDDDSDDLVDLGSEYFI